MTYLLNNYAVEEEKVEISGIPCIRLIPKGKEGKLKTIIFYHGLGSNKERQRIRAYILAFSGYQVFIPDSIYHGERDSKYTEDPNLIARYFWEAILNSVEESEILIDKIINKYEADKENIYVTGHSMGGFISAGVFTHNDQIKGAIPMNGCFNWERFNQLLLDSAEELDFKILEDLEGEINSKDPIKNMDKIKGRNFLILHAEKDSEVNIIPQKEFFETYIERFNSNESVDFVEYEGLGHFVTTGMMEEIIKWLEDRN